MSINGAVFVYKCHLCEYECVSVSAYKLYECEHECVLGAWVCKCKLCEENCVSVCVYEYKLFMNVCVTANSESVCIHHERGSKDATLQDLDWTSITSEHAHQLVQPRRGHLGNW